MRSMFQAPFCPQVELQWDQLVQHPAGKPTYMYDLFLVLFLTFLVPAWSCTLYIQHLHTNVSLHSSRVCLLFLHCAGVFCYV